MGLSVSGGTGTRALHTHRVQRGGREMPRGRARQQWTPWRCAADWQDLLYSARGSNTVEHRICATCISSVSPVPPPHLGVRGEAEWQTDWTERVGTAGRFCLVLSPIGRRGGEHMRRVVLRVPPCLIDVFHPRATSLMFPAERPARQPPLPYYGSPLHLSTSPYSSSEQVTAL